MLVANSTLILDNCSNSRLFNGEIDMKSIIALLLAMTFVVPAHALYLGKVDIQKVLLTVKQGQKVRDDLKKEFDKKQAELQKEESSIRKMQEDFEKQGVVMNDKAKAKKEQEIQ